MITLAKIGQLDLLSSLAHHILIPDAVAFEILAGSSHDAARIAIESGWGQQFNIETVHPLVMEWGLGAGESAVLSLSLLRQRTKVVIDDAMARRCARALSIPVVGTVGIILLAKKYHRIDAVAPMLHDLRNAGLYLHDEFLHTILHGVGEIK
jgi:predicted nucleic acid-binding protein